LSEVAGTPFGKYELLERLGIGGMAIVYRARYTAAPGITKQVVIKRVLDVYAENPAFVSQFIQEARVSVGLNHGNIVQVFDFGQVEGEYFLAMELVEGQPLSRVLKRAQSVGLVQLPAPLAVNIAIEMCKGLHHAHTRTDEKGRPLGLVHRDVSPDNVLISYEGEVKISDFGVAKARLAGRPETEAGMVKGKYLYFSPEQARGEELDARSDVYAVAVVLYRMLCGRLPAEGPEIAVMQRIVQGQLTPARQLNPQLEAGLVEILDDAMARRRADRIPSAEALQHQLSHWLATRAPLFPSHTLKYLMGVLYERELTELGRLPQIPSRFRDQLAQWTSAHRWRKLSEDTPPPAPVQEVATQQARVELTTASDASTAPEISTATHPTLPEESGVQVTETIRDATAIRPPVRRRRGWLFAAGGVLLLGLGLVAGWRLRAPPLEIRSEPPGAQVILDGAAVGQTPLTVQGVSPKEPHTVELSLRGMRTWTRRFDAGTLTQRLEVALEAVPPVAPAPEPEPPPEEQFASRLGTEQVPVRFTVQEQWHSFSTTTRSLQHPLDPKRSYTVWVSGSYQGDVPVSEQDLRKGLAPASSRSAQVYVFLEGEGVPVKDRLFMASPRPHTLSKARLLHAFVLVGITAERNADRALTLHVRDNASRKVARVRLDARRFAHQVARENRFSVRQLDPKGWYALEIQPRPGAPSSAVAVVVVPRATGRVQVSGQPVGELRHALPPGRYTVQGARELWFALPRWEGDGAGEMEVSLDKAPPPPVAPVTEAVPGEEEPSEEELLDEGGEEEPSHPE
jgi:serine/threonine-protein kinase